MNGVPITFDIALLDDLSVKNSLILQDSTLSLTNTHLHLLLLGGSIPSSISNSNITGGELDLISGDLDITASTSDSKGLALNNTNWSIDTQATVDWGNGYISLDRGSNIFNSGKFLVDVPTARPFAQIFNPAVNNGSTHAETSVFHNYGDFAVTTPIASVYPHTSVLIDVPFENVQKDVMVGDPGTLGGLVRAWINADIVFRSGGVSRGSLLNPARFQGSAGTTSAGVRIPGGNIIFSSETTPYIFQNATILGGGRTTGDGGVYFASQAMIDTLARVYGTNLTIVGGRTTINGFLIASVNQLGVVQLNMTNIRWNAGVIGGSGFFVVSSTAQAEINVGGPFGQNGFIVTGNPPGIGPPLNDAPVGGPHSLDHKRAGIY